jgi:hypothetical protein
MFSLTEIAVGLIVLSLVASGFKLLRAKLRGQESPDLLSY